MAQTNPKDSNGQQPEEQTKSFPWPDSFVVQPAGDFKRAGVIQDDPGGKVHRSGRTILNIGGTLEVLAMVRKQFDNPSAAGLLFALDSKTNVVAGTVVAAKAEDATPIRYNEKTGNATIYMNWIFKGNPLLRPSTPRWVAVTRQQSEKGEWIAVHLNMPMVRNRQPKKDQEKKDGQADSKKPANDKTDQGQKPA